LARGARLHSLSSSGFTLSAGRATNGLMNDDNTASSRGEERLCR
jgi:hypothetical protein